MLTDPREIEIISKARQKNVRDPRRSRTHFENIFGDFLGDVRWQGATCLDMGPGQYDFGELARPLGAEVWAVDIDPAVVELGEYKRFNARQANIRDITIDDFGQRFDGLFCKFAVNAFWAKSEDDLIELTERIFGLLEPHGWAWIAPWNGVPKAGNWTDERVADRLALMASLFEEAGFTGFELDKEQSMRYGVHGATADRSVFVRNLAPTVSLSRLEAA